MNARIRIEGSDRPELGRHRRIKSSTQRRQNSQIRIGRREAERTASFEPASLTRPNHDLPANSAAAADGNPRRVSRSLLLFRVRVAAAERQNVSRIRATTDRGAPRFASCLHGFGAVVVDRQAIPSRIIRSASATAFASHRTLGPCAGFLGFALSRRTRLTRHCSRRRPAPHE